MAVPVGERREKENTSGEARDPKDEDKDTEYLEVFEVLMKNLGKTEDLWSSYLQPVMNNACRMVFTSMPQHKREVYQELKMALLSTCSTESIRVGAAFRTYERQKGQTFPQMERKLSRLGQRFALKKNSFWRSYCRPYQCQRLRMSGEPSQRQPLQQHRQP